MAHHLALLAWDWPGRWFWDPSAHWYTFWSGFGSCLTEFAILGAIIRYARHKNCNVKGCWRFGPHLVAGTEHSTCRKHHPTLGPKNVPHEHVLRAHAAAQLSAPAVRADASSDA